MSLFFRPRYKAQKDRAILKRIDQTLSRQGLPSALLHFVIFLVIEWHLLQTLDSPKMVYVFGLALFVMAAWRFIMIAQFESWYGKGPRHWRDVFILSGFLHVGTWSCYLFYRLMTIPGDSMLLLGVLYTSAIAAGGTFVYSLYGKTVRIYLAILLVPLAVYYLIFATGAVNTVIGIAVIAMYFYMVSTADRISDLVWSFLTTNHEYKLRLSAFEQAREASTVQNSINRRFIQQLLHRVKNPLSGLLGVMGMLSVDDSENKGMLNIAKRSGYSILDLITDLETFIEQRDKTRVPQLIVFNLRKTLEHALADMGVKAHETGREISYLYHPDVPERVEADPQWLSNAFRRMIDFTIDMADQGEITVKIGAKDQANEEFLILTFYFNNSEVDHHDIMAAIERQMDVLPEDEDVADQLTLMVAAAQFKSMGAKLTSTSKDDLHKIIVSLPINTTSQQASSFRPAKFMSGKSILLIDLTPQTERSLTAEFMSWNMNVAVWTIDRLLDQKEPIETDYVFINVPVDDQKAHLQVEKIEALNVRFSALTQVVLYASELQRNLFASLEGKYTFVEKPVARDQLLSALREAKEATLEQEVSEYKCENIKILVAEDNLLNQKVVLKMLDQLGVQADTCVNGKEAIQLAEQGGYNLILMDYYMPRMDGLEATRRIRKSEVNTDKHITIVGMTSEQTPEVERECLAAGIDDFLPKPLQYDDVVELFQRWVG